MVKPEAWSLVHEADTMGSEGKNCPTVPVDLIALAVRKLQEGRHHKPWLSAGHLSMEEVSEWPMV